MNHHFPYKKFEGTEAWKVIEKALGDLEANGDFEAMTARRYLVGYLCKQLAEAEAIKPGRRVMGENVLGKKPRQIISRKTV